MRVAAIDQGTTSTRALVIDDTGNAEVVHTVKHRQHYPENGWVEHDPEELVTNIISCINAAGQVDALGIDNQGESCMAWRSDTKEPLTQVLVWQDKRTVKQIDALRNRGVEEKTLEIAGLPLDPYFSASKLGWIVKNVPKVKEAMAKGMLRLGTTDAFFLDRLTSRYVTDITTASRTSLMNLKTGQWDLTLCNLFEVPIDLLPEIVTSTGDFGCVDTSYGSVPVTSSIVDQQAALYGFGCDKVGDAKITIGTGAFALMVTGSDMHRAAEKGLLPTVAWQKEFEPPVYALDGGVFTASAAVNWAKALGLFQSFDDINRFEGDSAIDSGLVFVPSLSGLGCPHWNAQARGQWQGLSLEHTSRQLTQSILEGVAFRVAEVVEAMSESVQSTEPLWVDGGMSKNPYFVQFLCDALARPVKVADVPELTGIGTAQLAAEGAGFTMNPILEFERFEPLRDLSDARRRFDVAVSQCLQWQNSGPSKLSSG